MSVNFSVASAMEKSELDINDLPAMSNVASVESSKRELLDVPDCENADFYKKTLPQLGWKFVSNKENALHFERDMEVLDIVLEKNKPLLVRVTLKSKD